jgi:hypothetical protein
MIWIHRDLPAGGGGRGARGWTVGRRVRIYGDDLDTSTRRHVLFKNTALS